MKLMTKVLFIHHSVGRALLLRGRLRQRIAAAAGPEIELWDHDYNRRGLWDGQGRRLPAFPIPKDNTNPDGLFTMWAMASTGDPIVNRLREFDLVVMKSCFPNSQIKSDQALEDLRSGYVRMASHASEVGIPIALLTTPPIRTGIMTTRTNAARAADLAGWLSSEESPIERVFDLFSRLSVQDPNDRNFGRLRPEFTNRMLLDSHPNWDGSTSVAEDLSQFIVRSARAAQQTQT